MGNDTLGGEQDKYELLQQQENVENDLSDIKMENHTLNSDTKEEIPWTQNMMIMDWGAFTLELLLQTAKGNFYIQYNKKYKF